MSIEKCRPMVSSAVQPNIRSAPLFQEMMRSSAPTVRKASADKSMIAATSAGSDVETVLSGTMEGKVPDRDRVING
jgi:hypothetical protein